MPPDGSAAASWFATASKDVAAAILGTHAEQVGRVEEVGDGVALVSGLPGVRLDEKLRFAGGQFGFAQVLERGRVGCVLLDDVDGVAAGDAVRGTGDVVRVPVGLGLLGRVVDPLGRPLDGKGAIAAEFLQPIERAAPAIIDRDLVVQPVQTGLVVVDTLFALGRGQRELIIGDRAIGKTTVGIDTIINQKDSDIVCVYVAVGQKSSAVRRAIDAIEAYGAPQRCIVVASEAAGSPGLQWIAPFAAMTMAEYFRDRGQHALIVIDDLTKHAATHREIALLTRQSPGREAYPGDVFYVHARLLERAAKLSKEKGGGSLTALPIAETDAGNLSAYIPTNLISITDGQIALDAKLFYQGQKPAVDVGTSVSRVGGKTQAVALRDAAKTLAARLRTVSRVGVVHPLRRHARYAGAATAYPRGLHPRNPGSTAACAAAAGGRGGPGDGRAVGLAGRVSTAGDRGVPARPTADDRYGSGGQRASDGGGRHSGRSPASRRCPKC